MLIYGKHDCNNNDYYFRRPIFRAKMHATYSERRSYRTRPPPDGAGVSGSESEVRVILLLRSPHHHVVHPARPKHPSQIQHFIDLIIYWKLYLFTENCIYLLKIVFIYLLKIVFIYLLKIVFIYLLKIVFIYWKLL